MKNTKDEIRENMLNRLSVCLREIGGYDFQSVMPLFYTLVAHHQGYTLVKNEYSIDIKESNPSSLLLDIQLAFKSRDIDRRSKEIIFSFYESHKELIDDYYTTIIEYIISYCSAHGGKYSSIATTPHKVATLMSKLIEDSHPATIYDPCAGLCSYLLEKNLKEIPFVGQDINYLTTVIAKIRIDARPNSTLLNEDSVICWRSDAGDFLASELPFGLRLSHLLPDYAGPKLLEDFILYKYINTPSIKKAVLLVSMSTCYRKENVEFRKSLIENNWVDCVIKLPAGILPYASVTPAILILNKERKSNNIRFVLTDDCIENIGKSRVLDEQMAFNRISGSDERQSKSITVSEAVTNDYSLDPDVYVTERIEVLPGQKIVEFIALATKINGERRYEDKRGRVLLPEHMSKSIAEMHTHLTTPEICDIPANYVKVSGKAIIFNIRADRFFINDEDAIFVTPNFSCFRVNEMVCIPEYLADCILNNKWRKEQATIGAGIPRIDWAHLLLPIYESLDSQRQIIQRIFSQEEETLKRKLNTLQLLSGRSSDLIHNLGVTFTKISAGVGVLMNENPNETVESLNDNVQFALRQINSTGTDFAYVHPELKKVNLYEALTQYVKSWSNFGFNSFAIRPIKFEVSKDTKVEIDLTLFYTMLDCIFINAHQHGFNKRNTPDNEVLVTVEGVTYKDRQYMRIGISNNGNPLPDGFTVKDFASRSVVGINSSQDGIGGDHVCKIAHHFGGLISIDSESGWLTFNILLPVYLTSSETIFNDYETECI